MSAAWLLHDRHDIVVYEAAGRLGGHSRTVDAPMPVDMGFIVYNEANYPNLVALFHHLNVPTKLSDMSFAVSLDQGRLEYGGNDLGQLFAQKRNLLSPRFWSMLRDLARFHREAPSFAESAGTESDGTVTSLGAYLDERGFGEAFQRDHLLPMAAAIWSTPAEQVREYPAAALIRFCDNHGLLSLTARPIWRTVDGGSRAYVTRLTAGYANTVRLGCAATRITRTAAGIEVRDASGGAEMFDRIVIAAHADQALSILADPSADETALLGAFRYTSNRAVLHADPTLMPRRRKIWSSWNYLGERGAGAAAGSHVSSGLCVTYWMNLLQGIPETSPLFVTLNPHRPPRADLVIGEENFEHPLFDANAIRAQRQLWRLQGQRGTWFCGAYFGSGFHEDGLQAGLAAAEAAGGVRRPWSVANESGRIHLGPATPARLAS
jgi:predicted NAD/FAD-binding protein